MNANAKQLQNKWHNIKFNAKGKGRPNPYTDPDWDKDQDVISEQLQPYKELLEDENVEREIEAHLQQVSTYIFYIRLYFIFSRKFQVEIMISVDMSR